MVFNKIECYMYIKTYIPVQCIYIFNNFYTLWFVICLDRYNIFLAGHLVSSRSWPKCTSAHANLNGGFETIGTLLAAKISFLYKKWANVFLTEWRSNSLARQPILPHTRGRASMHWMQRSCVITAYPACDSRWNQLGEFMVNI